ncbi:MAG TPA: tetratricopeptide repeat protein, partial [bacterium]
GGGGGGGGGGDSWASADPRYTQAAKLIGEGRYEAAIPLLNQVLAGNPQDADAHNLLGYSTRKLGRLQEALAHYANALRINPRHRGAHEYLGEAYLELGQLDKAKEQLAFLDDDCWLPCREYSDLKEAVARYEADKG